MKKCPECDGSGWINNGFPDSINESYQCILCNGEGELDEIPQEYIQNPIEYMVQLQADEESFFK